MQAIDSVVDKNPENSLNYWTGLRWSPLGEAVSSGHLQVVKLIMSKVEEVVNKEVLARIAVENSHFGLCEFLIDGEKGSNCNPISQLFFFTLLSIMFPLQFKASKCVKWNVYGFFVELLLSTFAIFVLLPICLSPVRGGEMFWDSKALLVLLHGHFLFHFILWLKFFGPLLQSFAKRMKGL